MGRARITTARGSSIIQQRISEAASRGQYSASGVLAVHLENSVGRFTRLFTTLNGCRRGQGSSGAVQRSVQDLRGSDVPNLRQGCPTLARYGPHYSARGKGTNGLLDLQHAPVTPKKPPLPDGT